MEVLAELKEHQKILKELIEDFENSSGRAKKRNSRLIYLRIREMSQLAYDLDKKMIEDYEND